MAIGDEESIESALGLGELAGLTITNEADVLTSGYNVINMSHPLPSNVHVYVSYANSSRYCVRGTSHGLVLLLVEIIFLTVRVQLSFLFPPPHSLSTRCPVAGWLLRASFQGFFFLVVPRYQNNSDLYVHKRRDVLGLVYRTPDEVVIPMLALPIGELVVFNYNAI